MDLEPTNHPSVLIFIILKIGYSLEDLDKLLPLVLLLIQLPDILGGELSIERHAQHGLDPAEPWGDGWHEGDFQLGTRWEKGRKVFSGFAFVDVVRERVGPETTVKALRGHLRYSGRSTGGIGRPSDSTCTAVSRNTKYSRQGAWLEMFQQWGDDELRGSGVAPRVRDPLGLTNRISRVQLCQTRKWEPKQGLGSQVNVLH